MGSLVAPKPALEKSPPLPPMANPPVFANAYSQIAAGEAQIKGKKRAAAPGLADVNKTASMGAALAQPVALATPSLLG